MRTVFSVLLLSILGSAALAQEAVDNPAGAPSTEQSTARSQDEPPVRHISHLLRQTPEARRALEEFHRTKNRPRTLAGKVPGPRAVGDTAQFDVYNIDDGTWMRGIPFILKAKGPALYLWVEQTELDSSYVRDQDVDSLYSALQENTPRNSYNPDEGIIVNNNEIFGSPSDIDGNGRVHVLLTDIKDGRDEEPDAPFIAGFFHPADLASGPGNRGEILYLDTRPGIYTDDGEYRLAIDLQATAAHEYQHLILANYDGDEEAFVNEGLSEWAEIINGYPRRPAEYLSNASDSTGYNVNLFLWRGDSDDVLYDYQRSGLLTHYLAEQIGTLETGALTRSTRGGIGGYNQVLDDRNFREFLLDFHTANSLNDREYDSEYGYAAAGRQGLHAAPSYSYDSRIDRRTSETTASVSSGAVQYLEWNHVENLRVNLDVEADNALIDNVRSRFRIRAVGERPDGTITVDTFTPPVDRTFDGTFERVTLIAAHVAPNERQAQITFSARWDQRDQAFSLTTRAYDNGVPFVSDQTDRPVFFTTASGNAGMSATRFAVPDGESTILSKVSLAFYYLNQFNNGPPRDAPRDFTLHVWANSPDRTPGREIFSTTMNDPRSYRLGVPSQSYSRFTVDLAEYEDQLSSLPDTIFVGVAEAGTDDNYMVLAPAAFDSTNTSYVGTAGTVDTTWKSLWSTELENGVSLDQTTLPTRVEFLVPDTTGGPAADSLILAANYPNPFNNSTQIEFTLPDDGPVQLKVYDVLGRHITTLVNETLPADRHTVSFDGSGWASGVYFYVLQFDGRQHSRKMILAK